MNVVVGEGQICSDRLLVNKVFGWVFWPHSVVKRSICYDTVCLSVRPSVPRHARESRLKISRYQNDGAMFLHPWHHILFCGPEFSGSRQMSVLKRSSEAPPVDSENLTNTVRYFGSGACLGCNLPNSLIGSCTRAFHWQHGRPQAWAMGGGTCPPPGNVSVLCISYSKTLSEPSSSSSSSSSIFLKWPK